MNPILMELIYKYKTDIDANKFENLVYDSLSKGVFDEIISIFEDPDLPPKVFSELTALTTLPHTFSIDTAFMPSYLRKAHFAVWLRKFGQLLDKIIDSRFPKWNCYRANISIEFSDEEKANRYGSLTIDEVKEIIRDTWGKHKEIEEILSKISSLDDYRKLIQELMGAIHLIYRNEECESPEKLHSLLNEMEFEMPVLGEYINEDKKIILYTINIEKAADKCGNIPSREFEKVFIHELFHAYHYLDDKEELLKRRDYTASVVKESLASAFEWFYCVENKIKGADELKSSWDKHSVVFYPYSGAKNLLSETTKRFASWEHPLDTTEFRAIFAYSLDNMDSALRHLLDSHDFYKIKNLILYREKKAGVLNSRKAFDDLMKQDAIGEIAHREIPSIIRKNRLLIPQLMDLDYSKNNFHATQYPILSTSPMLDKAGRKKSYSDPVHTIGNQEFYLSAQWNEKQLDFLLDWIWANR